MLCLMVYCCGGNAADINIVFVLQKRAVRAIYKMGQFKTETRFVPSIFMKNIAACFIYFSGLNYCLLPPRSEVVKMLFQLSRIFLYQIT